MPAPDHNIEIAKLSLSIQHLSTLVEKQNEALEGTNRTPGLKEKLAIARYDIDLNKQAYHEVMEELKRTEQRLGQSMAELSVGINIKLDDKFKTLQADNEKQNTILQKIQPWINGVAWFVLTAGGVIISLLLSGKLHVGP